MSATLEQLKAALSDRYAIERELGQGGMATVYLAEDLRHDRKVALKVLRPELAAILGGDRFLQEIKTTANLQHPHILPLHDSGEAGGSVFYVMPYVEGETLRDRMSREKQLPVDDAVRIAKEVAGALDYAHRHGVVHRDIKPENVLLHDGSAMVADFGIALAASRSDGGTRMTETGMSLGTPHYMSPEQAMGEREITARSDVYALGCVLYEMLTGDPPFTGSTAQAIVARVVTEQPRQITTQRRTVPPHVEAAVFTALEKLPADRFASAAEFAQALDGRGPVRATAAARGAAPPAGSWLSRNRPLAGAIGVAAIAAVAAIAGWLRSPPEPPVIRYSLGLPADQAMQQGVLGVNLAISRDGRRIVYLGPGEQGARLWVRDRSRLEATPLPGTEGAIGPVFSPDGRHIAFSAGANFTPKVVAVDGGPPVALAEATTGSGGGVAWSDDGWIYFDRGVAYYRVRAKGGDAELAVPLDSTSGELGLAWPDVLPGGKQILFRSRRNLSPETFDIVVYDVTSRQRHVLTRGLLARYVDPGYLVYVRADGTLMAAKFQPGDTELRSSASPLVEGIMTKSFGSADVAISREGTLLYVPGSASGSVGQAVWVTREGVATPLQPPLEVSPSTNRALALSPDGTRLVVDMVGPQSVDLWVKQLPSGPFSRLTFEGRENTRPSWTPDGKSLIYISARDSSTAVWRRRADGSAPPELLLELRDRAVAEAVLSRDGRWLIYRVIVSDNRDIYGIQLGQDTTPVPLLASRFDEMAPALSPDGAWIAYVSDESGTDEVYVRPFPRTDQARYQISRAGGQSPRWSHNGRELFFIAGNRDMMVASVRGGPTFVAEEPKALFNLGTTYAFSNVVPYYDLAPRDDKFIMVQLSQADQTAGGGQLVVVEHWLHELQDKVEEGQR